MKEKAKDKITLDDFIDYYMEGNFRRFLRRHTKQHHFALTYSVTLKHVKKSSKKMYKLLHKHFEYPKHMSDCLNVFITLAKHFDIGFTMQAFKEYLIIEEELTEEIRVYMSDLRGRQMKTKTFNINNEIPTKKEAIKEQKARGFLHINDWDDYRNGYAHIISTADTDLYYPVNIKTGKQQIEWAEAKVVSPYIIQYVVGVPGWTRIEVPI